MVAVEIDLPRVKHRKLEEPGNHWKRYDRVNAPSKLHAKQRVPREGQSRRDLRFWNALTMTVKQASGKR